MFCNNCGKEINDAAYVCPYCGVRTPVAMQAEQQQQQTPVDQDTNGFAIAGLVLAFFFPLLGLIFSCIGYNRSKQQNGVGRGLSIAGIVVSVIEMAIALIVVIFYFSLLGAALSGTNTSFFTML